MMALQLPEPEYYTLAEVAERWEVSGDVLLRLGAEKKLIFAWPVLSGFRICHDFLGGCLRTAEEVEQLFPSLRPGQLLFRVDPEAKAIEILMGGLAYLNSYSLRPSSILHNGAIFSASFSRVSHFINNEQGEHYMTIMGGLPPLPAPYHFSACIPVRTSRLVIPTTEIHRLERKQEKVDQAIAKAEAESPIPSQSKRALNTRAKVIGALVQSHNINLADKGATSALNAKLELQGVALDRDTVKKILDEAREQIEKPN
ncbi:hypothetical protein HAP94_07480 [Acidithiobacillus ferrivorans]|nr:hypothetical protein [Acidithiobacillus ferrivorans]